MNRPRGVAIGPFCQTAQRRRTGLHLHPVGRGLQRLVVTLFPMIIQIFIAQRQRADALPHEVGQAVITTGPALEVF